MLISRPSWLLESSAIFISASNRSANMVISPFFLHYMTAIRTSQQFWHGLCRKSGMVIRARSLVFFLFQPVSYIGKEAPPGSAADHQFLNKLCLSTLQTPCFSCSRMVKYTDSQSPPSHLFCILTDFGHHCQTIHFRFKGGSTAAV